MGLLHLFYYFHTLFPCLHVERNQTMMTLRQKLVEWLVQSLGTYHWTNLQQSTKYNHVEHLGLPTFLLLYFNIFLYVIAYLGEESLHAYGILMVDNIGQLSKFLTNLAQLP